MNRNLLWKFLFILFLVAWAVWEIYPPTARSLIGEFESQAAHKDALFTNIVQKALDLQKRFPNREYGNLKEAIGTNDIARYFPSVRIPVNTAPDRAIMQQLQAQASGKIKLGLDLQGGTEFLVQMQTNKLSGSESQSRALSEAVQILDKRVNNFGVAEPIIQPVGTDEILVQLPGLSEAEKEVAKSQIARAAFLEFRLVHPQSRELLAQGLGAPGYEALIETRKNDEGREVSTPYLVKKAPEKGLTGKYVSRADVTLNPLTNEPEIVLKFNNEGAELFAQITKENVGRQLAIVLDGQLQSAPVIREPILQGTASISGDFSMSEAYNLKSALENPLEAPLQIRHEHSVEPTLGRDSIQSGLRACVVGTAAVMGFMLVYYMLGGLLADIALCLNIVMLLGVMCSFGTTLTLPGIAGIVLTIGMAVDANVLVLERIREESETGKSIRSAIAAGYDKAFGTIFDSHFTTLISSVILIFLGTGSVKGFGVALTIGVILSLFTALFVTRLIFDWMVAQGWLKRVRMLRLINPSNIDFLKWSKVAFALSWTLAIIGTGYGVWRGANALGVDFRGGDSLTLSFAQKLPDKAIRDALKQAGVKDATIQYQKDLSTQKETLQVLSEFGAAPKVEKTLQQKFPAARFSVLDTQKVGPIVAEQMLKTALIAVLLSLLGILIYVAMRYEFSFSLGAVIAIIHDVLMTIGWFCLTGRQFNAPMVAAILTIIGFSINDTVVIFDRIREYLRLGVRGSFKEVMNLALNRTLSRTIITSGTVFLATASLYLFGGPVINDFAFTFLVGIITGTYSSIYIASAFVLWWHKGERPKSSAMVVIDNAVAARV